MSSSTPQENPILSQDFNKYLILRPERAGFIDLFKFSIWDDTGSGLGFLDGSDIGVVNEETLQQKWLLLFSLVVRKFFHFVKKPMVYLGYVIEFMLNLLAQNGGVFGLFSNFVTGKMVVPERGSESFYTFLGHLDGRLDLYKGRDLVEQIGDDSETIIRAELGNRALMDLCIMASKLAYENAKVVQSVVTHHWKMHFVDFYDCWNDFEQESSTQVFIISDKPKDASLILISFRGTEVFDMDDWSTDIDYSWYEIPELGKVHMGFLEAIGLGNRDNISTFQNHLQSNKTTPKNTMSDHCKDSENCLLCSYFGGTSAASTAPYMVKKSAYYAVRRKLKSLLRENPNAKFVVTGHSLGGALAILFPTVLVLHEETELMNRLLGIYTFGQPRIGNLQLAKYMEDQLENPIPKYFRVVYCNDIVPRLPYDDKTFLYKHFGACIYYNSLYVEQQMSEEPDPNFFGLRYVVPLHLNALWELTRSFIIGYLYGPDYREGWLATGFRLLGLAIPGLSDHCTVDYVNSVRLGKQQ
ncbi:alpha/beta-Hydrolases superfamily protein [Euphorbia peplus]|nr:alpha/beta-Hydrolases superfamily protein [Euphorbia peplus]